MLMADHLQVEVKDESWGPEKVVFPDKGVFLWYVYQYQGTHTLKVQTEF